MSKSLVLIKDFARKAGLRNKCKGTLLNELSSYAPNKITFRQINFQFLAKQNIFFNGVLNQKCHFYMSTFTEQSPSKVIYRNRPRDDFKTLMVLVEEVLSLKDGGATSLVVENRLRSMLFYYSNLQKDEKEEFITEFTARYSVNHESVIKVSKQLAELETDSSGLRSTTAEKLRDLLVPKYSWLLKHLARIEGGVKFLVDFRHDILVFLSNLDIKSPHFLKIQHLSNSIRDFFALWFSPGFLHLQRVQWSSPCSLLEKIAEYEAVQPVSSWSDIKQRMGPYRRCFVYTHPSMPGEPLVILHVALTKEIEHSVRNIIHTKTGSDMPFQSTSDVVEDPSNIRAFIFYSISATQKGLQGIEMGNYLIKRAAQELHSEHPQAKVFSTLSPIPTFRHWLLEKLKSAEKGEVVLPSQDWEELIALINPEDKLEAWTKVKSMILDHSWTRDGSLSEAFKKPLMASCSRYLYLEKRRGFALDPVANFHLRNGAVMWQLNWKADMSPRGLNNSCGLMVNYRYYLDAADSNSLKYIQERSLSATEQIIGLATGHFK